MAIAHQNTQTQNWTNATSVTVTKPTGLAEGEYMFVFICAQVANVSDINFATGGWTEIDSNDDGTECWRAGYKVATAGDVAASNFSFALGGSIFGMGSITRVSGSVSSDFSAKAKQKVSAAATTTFNTLDITPSVANSLILFFGWHTQNTPGTHSNYAIVTSNPTWTEAYDISSTAPTPDYANFLAYASRPETTATGDFLVDCTATGGGLFGFALAIGERTDVTVSPSVIGLTANVIAPSITGGATVSPAVVDLTANVIAPTVTIEESDWVNIEKGTEPSWVNTDKS